MLIKDKAAFRRLYSSIRNGIDNKTKEDYDKRITASLINSNEFKAVKNILIYVSFGSEINTESLISYSLKHNKAVYAPVWNNEFMEFYRIDGIEQLSKSINGISVPDIGLCERLSSFEDCLCIAPGLSFDKFGNRLGYGGGYYDKFLFDNPLVTSVALCYERCFCGDVLPLEAHDIPISTIITENSIRRRGYING